MSRSAGDRTHALSAAATGTHGLRGVAQPLQVGAAVQTARIEQRAARGAHDAERDVGGVVVLRVTLAAYGEPLREYCLTHLPACEILPIGIVFARRRG